MYTCNSAWSHCKFFLKLFKQSIFVKSTCTHVFSADTKHEMYFPQLIQVISRSCFRFMPAAPTIVRFVLYTCPDWPVISTYILHCVLSTTLAVPYSLFIFLVYIHPRPPIYYMFRHCFHLSGHRDASANFFHCFKFGKFGH